MKSRTIEQLFDLVYGYVMGNELRTMQTRLSTLQALEEIQAHVRAQEKMMRVLQLRIERKPTSEH